MQLNPELPASLLSNSFLLGVTETTVLLGEEFRTNAWNHAKANFHKVRSYMVQDHMERYDLPKKAKQFLID